MWKDKIIISSNQEFLAVLSTGRNRLIIPRIDSDSGFVEGELQVLGDYRVKNDGYYFAGWSTNILSLFDDDYIIMLGNTSHHFCKLENVINSSCSKEKIVTWLSSKRYDLQMPSLKFSY